MLLDVNCSEGSKDVLRADAPVASRKILKRVGAGTGIV